jgi:hypothetical protein
MYPAFVRGAMTAGPEGVRDRVPIIPARWKRDDDGGVSRSRSLTDLPSHHVLPFPILGPFTRSTNSNSVTDHGAINIHPLAALFALRLDGGCCCELKRQPRSARCGVYWERDTALR